MNLYLLSHEQSGYDYFSGAVVAAESEERARLIHPYGDAIWEESGVWDYFSWCRPEDVEVELIGKAKPGTKEGVILASYRAG